MINPSEFQNYLQKICRHYEQWRTEVALTNTIANQQATFSFEQMVQTEEKTKTEEKPQKISLPIFQGIQNYLKFEHILLVGSPGVGKSTALLRCLIQFAKEELGKPEPRIPVLVTLKRYNVRFSNSEDPSGILGLIKDTLEPELWLEISEIKKLLFQDKRLILLLDGLNEMPSGTVRTELEEFRKKCDRCNVPFICTTREGGGTLGIKRQLKIQPPSPLEIERFLRECMPDQGQQVLQLLRRDNRELSRTPFVLWMLYQLFQEQRNVETLGEAFSQFFKKYLKEYKKDAPVDERREDWNLWLECLAFTMLNSPLNESSLVISEELAEKVLAKRFGDLYGASSRIKELLKYHLLERVSEKEVSFHHQLIQEYYAAECLLPQLSELIKAQTGQKYTRFQIDYLNYLKWTEAIAIMLGLPEITENQAEQLIKLALDVDLYLGARLAGEVKPKWQEKTVGLVVGLKSPKLLKIKLLGVTKSEQTIPQLETALEDRNAFIRWLAVLSLTKIGNVAAVHVLAKALIDENSSIRWRTISALKAIGNEAVVNTLMKALTYKDCDIRKNVVYALGEIKNVAAVESLVQALEDDNADVHGSAVYALGEIGDLAATNALIKALKYKIVDVRKNAASALGKIKNVAAVESLVQALKDDDAEVRSSAASALGKMGDPAAVHALVRALKDENTSVRASAADALGKIGVGDSDTVNALVNALKDEEYSVRQNAVRALDKVGNSTAIDGLIELLANHKIFSVNLNALSAINNISNSADGLVQALKHENHRIRRAAASSLSKFSSFAAISALVQALEDEVPSVREKAAFALAKIGNPDTVDSLIQALKDEDANVRFYAAIALGKIGNATAVNSLVQVLKDKEAMVRSHAAISLRQIGNPAAINALIENLENEDEEIRCQAIFALKKIGKDAAINSIVKSLKDESKSVRSSVIAALKQIGNSTAIDGLVQALEDQEADIRRRAVNALEEIGNQTAIEALIKALEHKYADVRHNAVYALAKIDNPTAINALIKALENEDADVRYRATSALGKIGNPSTVNNLLTVLKDEDASVRGSAASALGKIGNPIAVSALIEALEDDVPSVADNAAYALGKIANPTAINALIDILAQEDSVVYESAALILGRIGNAAAVDGLVKIFKGENSDLREFAASFLGEISNQAAVNALLEALQDENQDVRKDAASVLNKVSKPIAINALAHALKNENFVAANQGDTFCLVTEALQAIQENCKCYNYEIYQQDQESDNLGFEDNIIRKLYEDIDQVIYRIQENPELRQNDTEDRLTLDIVHRLPVEYEASHESKIGGHVDLVVRNDNFLWLGEAKIYRDNNSLWKGFLQLTTRYSIGDSNQEHGGLLIYIREGDASSIMKKWQEYLLGKNLPDYSFKPCKMRSLAFISTHRHERSGQAFHVRHMPVMIQFNPKDNNPKDKRGRGRKKSPQTP